MLKRGTSSNWVCADVPSLWLKLSYFWCLTIGFVPSLTFPASLTCCLRDVAALSSAALSVLLSFWSVSSIVSFLSNAASTISKWRHLSRSSSSIPAKVAFNLSPIRTRSLPDQREFTQPRRPAIVNENRLFSLSSWTATETKATQPERVIAGAIVKRSTNATVTANGNTRW